ncbi:methyltransferase [Corallococcus sp. ZKHCc1 1396]|uniref:Methyltransferase n=1 Tax=Corallococcus soli TaxID=2710757 RepID=A0ABR9PUG2_9BACT|nr:methyltransferase [Corallococcus soli]
MKSHHAADDAIAIVGLACRFPGARNAAAFWENLREGVTSISSTPEERWYWGSDPRADDVSPRRAGYLSDVDRFDARFFGLSRREAEWMDPQQRIMLELAYACLEDSGHAPTSLSGAAVGVYVGVSNADYRELYHLGSRLAEPHTSLGLATSLMANRISHHFNWKGPSVPVDTACSSSLVALHQAVRDLRAGDCDHALVGGVNLCLTPFVFNCFTRAGMLSPDGLCKTFDARADGYVRGEGAGFVLLRPLSRALADGDAIYGVVRGTAVNHGGAAVTLTSPNAFSQSAVIEKAFRDADVRPDQVSYVEAHGTGTPLGDPIEITALKRAFSHMARDAGVSLGERTIALGSVKTQVGHLESAAGIAGLAKVLLALQHEELPGLGQFQTLNPRIRLERSPFHLPTRSTPWPRGERVAGLSSFGFGGVNAHAVIAEAPARVARAVPTSPSAARHVFVLSAPTGDRLKARAADLLAFLERESTGAQALAEDAFASLLYTLQVGRDAMSERLAAVVGSAPELVSLLRAFVTDGDAPSVMRGRVERAVKGSGRDADSWDARTLCARWTEGAAVDWARLHGEAAPWRMRLPTYPFDDQRYWQTEKPAHLAWGNPTVSVPDRSATIQALLARHLDDEQARRDACVFGVHRALHALGLGTAQRRAGLRERLGVAANHERLLGEMLRIAASAGLLLEEDGDLLRLTGDVPPPPPRSEAPTARLLWTCLDNLVPVLRGETRATEVVFPNGSMELVEAVYAGNDIADFFNVRAADAVEAAVVSRLAHLPPGESLRLLEVGAGTGGTSQFLFERLRPYADRLVYTYTDRSRSFLMHAERFREQAPSLTLAVLDIEKPFDSGSTVEPGPYDIVVASNVLHATRDIQRTVENVGAFLAPGGVLVLNELASVTEFTTLTFGLLEGWWLFEDAELRMPGSPALSFAQWSHVLGRKRFVEIRSVAGVGTEHLGQQLVTAVWSGTSSAATRAPTARNVLRQGGLEAALERRPDETPEQSLIATLAVLLKVAAEEIVLDARLNDLGVDSLVAMDLRSQLGSRLGCTIPMSLYLDDLTVGEAAQRLAQLQGTSAGQPPAAASDDNEEGHV